MTSIIVENNKLCDKILFVSYLFIERWDFNACVQQLIYAY